MNTTNLFVELVVIGAGATIGLLLLVLSIFGYTWVPWKELTSSTMLIPLLSIIYLLGIIVDRISDQVTKKWDQGFRLSKFSEGNSKIRYEEANKKYHKARTFIYSHASNQIISLFEYGRSRLRICRAWGINSIVLGISIPLFFWRNFPQLSSVAKLAITFLSIFFFGILAIINFFTWRKLTLNDYQRLLETYNLLMSEKDKNPPFKDLSERYRC